MKNGTAPTPKQTKDQTAAVLSLISVPSTSITLQNHRHYRPHPGVRHVMLDIETLSTGSSAIAMTIGCAMMDEKFNILDSLEFGIDWQHERQSMKHYELEWSTFAWWLNQNEEARQRIIQSVKLSFAGIFALMRRLVIYWDCVEVWSNGAAFDVPIIENIYRTQGEEVPWKFWNVRCFRTVKSLYKHVHMSDSVVPHGAREDAIAQAIHLGNCLRR